MFVDTPLEECARRDPKGLYARARAARSPGLTGVDDPYEAPTSPELEIGGEVPVAEGADRVLGALRAAK